MAQRNPETGQAYGTHHSGSGGYQDNYKMETEGSKWQAEREDDSGLKEAIAEGEKQGKKTQDLEEKNDPDYKVGADETPQNEEVV